MPTWLPEATWQKPLVAVFGSAADSRPEAQKSLTRMQFASL
jgi:hypothetical protein